MPFESIRAMLDTLKNEGEIKELIAETQSKNLKSCQLLKKLGFELDNTVVRFGENQNIYKLVL